jgi:hypothetical protein
MLLPFLPDIPTAFAPFFIRPVVKSLFTFPLKPIFTTIPSVSVSVNLKPFKIYLLLQIFQAMHSFQACRHVLK